MIKKSAGVISAEAGENRCAADKGHPSAIICSQSHLAGRQRGNDPFLCNATWNQCQVLKVNVLLESYLSPDVWISLQRKLVVETWQERTQWPIQQQIKLRWALFVTYTIIQSIMRSEMCSLHLTHPSVHTWSSGQPTVQRPGSSRGLPAGAGIRTHNLGLPQVSSPTLYPLGQRLPRVPITQWYTKILNCTFVPLHHLYI